MTHGENNFDNTSSGGGPTGSDSDSGSGSSFTLPQTLKDFAEDPSGFVKGIVATWIVGGILMVGRQVADAILLAFDSLLVGLESATGSIIGSLDAVAAPIGEVVAGVPAFYVGLVEPLGPLAPVVTVAGVVVTMVILYRAGKAILLEIPILGGFLEFLGVDL